VEKGGIGEDIEKGLSVSGFNELGGRMTRKWEIL
jgi:hypothetical protein